MILLALILLMLNFINAVVAYWNGQWVLGTLCAAAAGWMWTWSRAMIRKELEKG